MNVLVLNAGSATLKFRLLDLNEAAGDAPPRVLVDGMVDKWGTPDAGLRLAVAGANPVRTPVPAESPTEAAGHVFRVCQRHGINAVGHRVVHGGQRFVNPVRITPEVVAAIREVSSLAPLHNANALEGIEAGLTLLPGLPAVAVFDTAFHRTLPGVAAQYAIPRDLAEAHGLRRYGFHGLSHAYVSRRLLRCLGRGAAGTRLVTCHLGNGASVAAIRDGRSVDTSMGLTPMEGLVMGTRSGDVDPGLVLHLVTALGLSPRQVDDVLNHRSGLLGLCGHSDMREVEQAADAGDEPARFALEVFAYRVRKYIGAYAAALGGLDAVGFTGGIGEHSPATRAGICRGLEFLGLRLDPDQNHRATGGEAPARVSPDDAAVQVWVVPTDEEGEIARAVYDVLRGPPPERKP